jgi:RNA recognition motif-containing protein
MEAQQTAHARKMFLGNLPRYVNTADLEKFLHEVSVPYKSVVVVADKSTGRSRGFAFVNFASEHAMRTAVAVLDGMMFHSNVLLAQEAVAARSETGGGRDDRR